MDVETSDYIHLQGAGLSENNDISLDHTGVKQEKIRDGYNENSRQRWKNNGEDVVKELKREVTG